MLKVAITGNIASGKSEVENILRQLNYCVIDTDKVNNDLICNDENTISQIKSIFQNFDIIDENKQLCKIKIANIIFNNKDKRQQLENLLHKKIFEKLQEIFTQKEKDSIVFVAVPLLFEANWQQHFDKILLVTANETTRLNRLMKRNNLSKEQAQSRINAQLPEIEKIKKSDFVIQNNSDFETLKNKTIKVLNEILNH